MTQRKGRANSEPRGEACERVHVHQTCSRPVPQGLGEMRGEVSWREGQGQFTHTFLGHIKNLSCIQKTHAYFKEMFLKEIKKKHSKTRSP